MDAGHDEGKRYVVTSDELLTSFLGLQTKPRQRNLVEASRLLVVCHPIQRSSRNFAESKLFSLYRASADAA